MSDEAAGEPVAASPPVPVPTGDPRVDDVLARLRELDAAPLPGHVLVFEEIHQRLQDLLASADQDEHAEQGDQGAGRPPQGTGPRP